MIDLTIDRPSGDKVVAAFSQDLSRLLIQVNGHFPVDAFRDLQARLITGTTNKKEYLRFKELSIIFLNTAAEHREDTTWAETFLFLCLHYLEEHLHDAEPWPDGFHSVSFEEMQSPATLVCNRLLRLYTTWTTQPIAFPCARPYAFYLLMEIVQSCKSIRSVMEKTGNEFVLLKDFISVMNGTPDAQLIKENELIRFAKKYRENQSILASAPAFDRAFAVRNYTHLLRNRQNGVDLSKGLLSEEKTMTALVVGSPGSGKTVMIKSIFQCTLRGEMSFDNPLKSIYVKTYPEGNEASYFLIEGRPAPTVSNVWALEGKIDINKTLYNIKLTDTRGGAITTARQGKAEGEQPGQLEKTLSQTDLLIIALEPKNLLESNTDFLNGLGARIDDLFLHSKHAMVSIVLTKFDEYGVVISGPRSLLNTESKWEKLQQFQDNASETAWDLFAEEVLNGFNDNLPLRNTLVYLLQKLKPLLSEFCNTHKHLPVNLYITNAIEAKDAISFQRTGIPFLFNDFEAYASCLIDKFPLKPIVQKDVSPPVHNLQVTGEPDNEHPAAIRLSWNAVPDCQYLIKKKVRFKNGVWTSWQDEYAINITSDTYIDRQSIKRGHSYQYQVIAVKIASKQKSLPAESPVYVIPIRIPWLLIVVISVFLIIILIVWFA